MVAITTDTQSDRYPAFDGQARLIEFPAPGRTAAGGHPAAPDVLIRVAIVLAAVAVVLAVAVGSAAWGRFLDGERGIPTSASDTPSAVVPG